MKKSIKKILFFLVIIFLILASITIFSYYEYSRNMANNEIITVASWNLQVYGDKKARNLTIINHYAEEISKYDIVFIQEIRDIDGSAFKELCEKLPDYNCVISSRAGRSSSKEQYGIVFLKKFNISVIDYNPDPLDRWERPPIEATINYYYSKYSAVNNSNYSALIKEFNFTAYIIHTRPDSVEKELYQLEHLINNKIGKREGSESDKIMIIGDLNADCGFYDEKNKDFKDWFWVIGDDEDTTSGKSICAYDRIILNKPFIKNYLNHGIEKTSYSDHYLIWIAISLNNKKFNDWINAYFN